MDRQTALQSYIQAILPEREAWLYQRALNKARPITRGMTPAEAEEYLGGKAFASALYHVRRADSAYQALKRSELALDFHQAEFERLEPLIEAELRRGGEIDLDFLRSVERSRVPLKRAREALRRLEEGAPRRLLEGRRKRLIAESEGKVQRWLQKADLSRLARRDPPAEQVVADLMKQTFEKGVPPAIVEQAWQPWSLAAALRGAIDDAFPELSTSSLVVAPSGRTVSDALRSEVDRAKSAVCAGVRKRFPEGRIRRRLAGNASLKRLQRQADAARQKENRLKSALLTAIPEHYRDLYPLARQLRRRFILHLGPTNSGKTYEGVARLRGARRGIYLGPLRLLAVEQFETLNLDDVPCSLVTGEEQIRIPGSRVQSSTVEMADLKTHYDVAVIDECQMIGDRDRGGAWTAAILGLCADEIHACASPDAVLEEIQRRKSLISGGHHPHPVHPEAAAEDLSLLRGGPALELALPAVRRLPPAAALQGKVVFGGLSLRG